MAQSTGTITLKNEIPPRFAIYKLDDGRGNNFSQVTFVVFGSGQNRIDAPISSSLTEGTGSNSYYMMPGASNNDFGGGNDNAIGLYRTSRPTDRNGFYISSKYGYDSGTPFNIDNNTIGDWQSLWCNTGSQPIEIEFGDGRGNYVYVDFEWNESPYDTTSSYEAGNSSNVWKKTGEKTYSINFQDLHGSLSIQQDYLAKGLYYVLLDAKNRGILSVHTPALSQSDRFLHIANPDSGAGDKQYIPTIRLLPSGSGIAGSGSNWTRANGTGVGPQSKHLNKPPFSIMTQDITSASQIKYYVLAMPYLSGTVAYTSRNSPKNGSNGQYLDVHQFAHYWARIINDLPIQISASVSTSTNTGSITLTNTAHGTDGNVAISSSYQHSVDIDRGGDNHISISGMTGGAALGGGYSIMARTRIGTNLIAVGGITRDNVASGSVEIAHLNFVAGEGAASWGGVLADGDLIAVHDTSADTVRSIELADLKSYMSASVITNLTASGDVLLGDATSDTINVTGRFISSLVPKTDGLNDLGTNALAWNTLFAESGSFSDNVGVGNNLTVIDTVSGSAMTTHTATADKVVAKQINTTSLTASGGVTIGDNNADDLSIIAGLITDFIPQNDSQVDLGSSSKQFAEAHIDTGYIDVITASYARITSLDVDTIVSRTVTKDSLEIKDNLIIAGVSGSVAGDYVGSGFQIGGTVGVQGTGSNPLMSLTLGSRTLTGDSMIVNVDGQAGASFKSGSVTQAALGKAGMRFGVTGSVSGSLLQAKRAELGHIAVGKVSGVKLVGSTSVSGATGQFHDLEADDAVFGGLTISSITASNGVLLGSSNADDLGFLGGLITSLVPQNDEQVSLGSAAKQFAVVYAGSASFGDNVGVGGTLTAIEGLSSPGTISGSASTFQSLTADTATLGGATVNSLTASNGVMIGTANSDDLSILSGLITDLVPQNDEQVSLGSAAKQYSVVYAASASFGDNVGVGGTLTAVEGLSSPGTISGSAATFFEATLDKLHGRGIVTQDNVQTGSIVTAAIVDANVTTAKLAAKAVTKAKLAEDIVQNNADAHGGLTWASGRLSVGWRKQIFVRADGSNISGSAPTKGMFATNAVPTPYTTASLGARPQSGSLMVYLNGVLLHGEHDMGDQKATGSAPPHADYRVNTGSNAPNWTLNLNEAIPLGAQDILTVTYLSGTLPA